jgi:hypothetical protein
MLTVQLTYKLAIEKVTVDAANRMSKNPEKEDDVVIMKIFSEPL